MRLYHSDPDTAGKFSPEKKIETTRVRSGPPEYRVLICTEL